MAKQKLGTAIPWLVDNIDNRFKHAMGDRPNSEFIVSPEGKIIVKRAWSNPDETRQDLERLVGKSDTLTRPEDLDLTIELPTATPAADIESSRIDRTGMFGLICDAVTKEGIYYAKLRVEAAQETIQTGKGNVYLGFQLDPIHQAHWNNLSDPLSYSLELPPGVEIGNSKGTAKAPSATYDSEPREFLLDVENWDRQSAVLVTVNYVACIENECIPIQQQYRIRLQRDPDSGAARGPGAGNWEPTEFAQRLLQGDANGDGKLNRDEVMGLIRPHFELFDVDGDQLLDSDELKKIVEWLNDPKQGIAEQLERSAGRHQ